MSSGAWFLAPEVLPLWGGSAFLLGLVVGSFANVCIHRLPRGASVVWPRSRCPSCGAGIQARDNVPLLSYAILRGRCRSCGVGIPLRYPAVEAANGLLYAGTALQKGPTVDAVLSMAFLTALLVLALIDVDHHLLPDRITKPGVAVGILTSGLTSMPAPWGARVLKLVCPPACLPVQTLESACAAGVGYAAMALIALVAGWYYREEALGRGDWKLVSMIGAFRGGPGMWMAGFLGAALGAVVGVVLLVAGRAGRKTHLPLGAFLCAGAALELFAGPELLAAYRRLFMLP